MNIVPEAIACRVPLGERLSALHVSAGGLVSVELRFMLMETSVDKGVDFRGHCCFYHGASFHLSSGSCVPISYKKRVGEPLSLLLSKNYIAFEGFAQCRALWPWFKYIHFSDPNRWFKDLILVNSGHLSYPEEGFRLSYWT